jgi:flagellar M-ring protein FliF
MDFKVLLQQITDTIQKLTLKQKSVIAASLVALVGFLVFLVLYNSKSGGSGYSVLFDKVSPSDSALILQQLEKDNVPYKIINEGTIEVPSNVVYKERIAIAAKGIPKDGKVGFELFDKQNFGSTDFEQRIKYLRALEGELSRTVEGLDPIEKADIHIALPKESVFTQSSAPPTASVVVHLRPLTKLSNKQIAGIKNLIASSVSKMKPENVKVIDPNGVTLGNNENEFDSDAIKAQIHYKNSFEASYENKIEKVLAPIVGGTDKVVARVSMDFDFNRKSEVSEIYDPNSVPRSEQSEEIKKEGSTPAATGGVPGAVSNIGPVQGIQKGKGSRETYTKSTTTTNYEISKKVLKSKGEFATLKRVTAAVVVDGKYVDKKDKDGKVTGKEFVPLSPKELAQIKSIVEQTIGYDKKRGDEVTVSSFEFKPLSSNGEAPITKTFVDKFDLYISPVIPIIKFLAAAILLFVFYKKVIVPFSQKMLEETFEDHEESIQKQVIEEEESAEDTLDKFREMKKKVEEQLGIEGEFNEEEVKYDVLLDKLKELADNKSEDVANIIESLFKSERDISLKSAVGKEK